ncbi:hypothetical protein Clacol_007457 [Clathrus columnatus]|uniref:C2 domain-containing protein n=1 Tax=Clathrus columnatus TaxID=1419009 RepID=A0AAV5AL91_9AGAM|nr:hypothetical protein Clacol_007457 [Clathrus columnatus]
MAAVLSAKANPIPVPEPAVALKRAPRRGDSGERGGDRDHDRRVNIVRSIPIVDPSLKAIPIEVRSPRHGDSHERNDPDHDRRALAARKHGDSHERNDPDHDRRALAARRHGDSKGRNDSHDRRELAARRHGDSKGRNDSHDRRDLAARRHGDSKGRGDSHDRRDLAARRHGDSKGRGDSHDRRDLAARRHGDSKGRGDSHNRRELAARRHGDSKGRGDSHDRRDLAARRHGDSKGRGDSHNRRELAARRHGDSKGRNDSHNRRELAARRHGDSKGRGDSHDRRDLAARRHGDSRGRNDSHDRREVYSHHSARQLTARRHGDSHERNDPDHDRRNRLAARRHGDSHERNDPDHTRRALGARRHGDSSERNDPDHDRRELTARRHGDGENEPNDPDHDRRELAARRHGDGENEPNDPDHDRRELTARRHGDGENEPNDPDHDRRELLKATHVPVSDLSKLSCDPFIRAKLKLVDSDDTVTFRTHTMRNTLNPVYNSRWIVCGIPSSGFILTLALLDEDVVGTDKKLGKATISIPCKSQRTLLKSLDTGELECKVEKRRGGIRTHIATYVAFLVTRGKVSHHVRIWVRIRVLDYDYSEHPRLATLGPPWYTRHFSPLIGHFISGYGLAKDKPLKGKNGKPVSPTTFIANRLQLSGPPPASLRFRYVAYNTFIGRLFTRRGFRGKFLHYALHRQYKVLYGYSKTTAFGVCGDGEFKTDGKANSVSDGNQDQKEVYPETIEREYDLARQFLEMTCHGPAMFTYVITLDSEFRFTETGEEFSIDFLSKHSMHADAAKEITFSGEFFVRRLSSDGSRHLQCDEEETTDPRDYELVIDNNSGTYRPKKELLPVLQNWLRREDNFGALGKITAIDGFDKNLIQWKGEIQDLKRQCRAQSKHHKKEN